MTCPYCSGNMIQGRILGDRYQLKWMPDDKKEVLGIWARDCIKLGSAPVILGRPKVKSYLCEECKKMIIDTDDSI